MKVLFVHNRYQQPGGEDAVFASEGALLEAHGHRVVRYAVHNETIEGMNPLVLAGKTVWNPESYRTLYRLIREERPQVVHVHNTLPLLSPSVYYAARAEGVSVVQTLHNFRLLCPNALFFRDGHVCEDCLGKAVPWPGVFHACYRGSRAATGVVAAMLTIHRVLGTWWRIVDVYLALTEFARQKFIEGGLPAEKIVVKPNFVHPDPGVGEGKGSYAIFVGRLSPEKGVRTLLAAWKGLGGRAPLKIVGDGPLASRVSKTERALPGVEWLGRKLRNEVLDLMKQATFLMFPSEWYEGFPMAIAEAYATRLPVVASDLGAMASLIDHCRTGLHFTPGDPEDLAAKVEWAWTHPKQMANMGREARRQYEARYTADRNYEMLMDIYRLAIERARGRG